jgi:hypothetical protein
LADEFYCDKNCRKEAEFQERFEIERDRLDASATGSKAEGGGDYNYFLPAFFAAQYAFNLRDNFALITRLNVFFLAVAAGLAERVAGLARRRLAHLAL